ncbi:hypothetical protein E1A91_D08G251800v1 [Gossypium mustelinum]|uniref:Lipoxygenase n=1 Tax=Gossypium mustelinum TaxID=34275 RepID=A0A5D2U0C4_GOSMU|nr:hypothetical protein E1A91_D08G251800v1 [Gossypium mustelinum]
MKIPSTVVLMRKTEQDFNDPDDNDLGNKKKVSLKLISADIIDSNPENKYGGKVGSEIHLEGWNNRSAYLEDRTFHVYFEWDEDFGTPGAVLVHNPYESEFYLKTITLQDVPGRGPIHFLCNSWVYQNQGSRIFFSTKAYLPRDTPEALRKCREEELRMLRGNGEGKLEEWDRVYDYAVYNDLGRLPVLGGSHEHPYPRRGRTGRPILDHKEKTENRNFKYDLFNDKFNIYVPRDEQFSLHKKVEFQINNWKSLIHAVPPGFKACIMGEFESFQEINTVYDVDDGTSGLSKAISRIGKFPLPQVIKEDRVAWSSDEEFAREMIAGLNPLLIRLLKEHEFPPLSKLDPEFYGNQNSCITKQDIQSNLDGHSAEQALKNKRLFILDHHDSVMPYLRKINKETETKTYASRTLLFLRDDNTLKPVAIELSLPNEKGDKFGAVSKVYTPTQDGVEGHIWQLAKAYVAVVDTGHHQLISHWLNTHAAIEPFIIATNRQLSVVHPIYKLLHPHYRDTMAINALAREVLVIAGGVLETTFYTGQYSMEMSSVIYRSWNFMEQSLPNDLKKRGIADGDINSLKDLDKLVIEDYPYAVDGLKIWFAIKKWVSGYCSFYYKTDGMVQEDPELQAWWKELREVGHGDKKDEPWWPKMQTREELIESCTIIIWLASAFHAAVNFGQYAYGGYSPNRPTGSRRFMPERGTPEYTELANNPEKAFLKTITSQLICFRVMAMVEILSQQSSEEVYLGTREDNWTTDKEPLSYFKAFHDRLAEIEDEITSMNEDGKWKNRVGPVKVPYTLLFPTGEVGLPGKGIPNSISI